MDTVTAKGYMIEAKWDGRTLTVHGDNKASRIALAGQDHGAGDVELAASDLASVRLKGASMMTNGNLIVRSTDGRKYQMHFRRKQSEDFERLYEALLPFVPVPEDVPES